VIVITHDGRGTGGLILMTIVAQSAQSVEGMSALAIVQEKKMTNKKRPIGERNEKTSTIINMG